MICSHSKTVKRVAGRRTGTTEIPQNGASSVWGDPFGRSSRPANSNHKKQRRKMLDIATLARVTYGKETKWEMSD
jgi:hypothetical protein